MISKHRLSVALLLGGISVCVLAQAADPNPPSMRSTRGAWPIRRQWNRAETLHYARWMENIFEKKTKGTVEQRTAKIERIVTDPEMNLLMDPAFLGEGGNPQLSRRVIHRVHNMIDCGKFTAFLPAYYAYRRALPWMSAYVRSGDRADVRNAAFTIPVGDANSFLSGSTSAFFQQAINGFSSGNYRVELTGRNAELSDTVPVAITREFLLPGCVNYVDGHCLLLAKVTEYGELRFLNASTTKTRDIFTYNGLNTVHGITPRGEDPENEWKGCFQGLRVFRYPIAETNSQGRVIRVRRRTNAEMAEFGFSTEQYDRAREMTEEHAILEGGIRAQSFHDFIRLRMKTVDTIAPLRFMEDYIGEIVEAYRFREQFVQEAWQDHNRHGPVVYPEEQEKENIFQAFGRWETWSSPSSDVDRRNLYFYLADWLEYAIRWFGLMPEATDLAGLEKYEIRTQADLARALIEEKNRIFAERSITYTNSKGEQVTLTLTDIEGRLYDLSFDPNHPPELRWGAPMGSAERASAPSTYTPVPSGAKVPMEEAYKLEAFYRTVCQRETETSYLRQMFTEGYPVRSKLDRQLQKWSYQDEPTEAIQAWLKSLEPEPPEPPYVLVPHDRAEELLGERTPPGQDQ